MTDVAPELYKKIESSFDALMAMDPRIRSFRKKVENETATSEDVSAFAGHVGECASTALTKHLKEENLPNGMLYYNIAEKTIKPIFKKAHELINEAACSVQAIEDKKLGIGLKPIYSDFPEERVNALINKLVHTIEEQGGNDEQDR